MDKKFFEDLSQKLTDVLPSGLKEFKSDAEDNFRGILQGAFAKMDLVTREEFDVQADVLSRTREKLDILEAQVEKLEEQIQSNKE